MNRNKIVNFPGKSKKELSDEGILRTLDAIYNEEEIKDDSSVLYFPNGYKPSLFESYHNSLARMNAYRKNMELSEYIDKIDKCVLDFDKYSSKLKGLMLDNNYKVYRKKIINVILEFVNEFSNKYNFSNSHNLDKLIINGITIDLNREDFSLEYMYNTLVNMANFMDDYDIKR